MGGGGGQVGVSPTGGAVCSLLVSNSRCHISADFWLFLQLNCIHEFILKVEHRTGPTPSKEFPQLFRFLMRTGRVFVPVRTTKTRCGYIYSGYIDTVETLIIRPKIIMGNLASQIYSGLKNH